MAAPAVIAYVINLESATKRWSHILSTFSEAGINFIRIDAIDGNSVDLRPAVYSENAYRWRHGRETNPPEVGCYLSHLRALEAFLASDAEIALICEDDITVGPDLSVVLTSALTDPRCWNVLRLAGLSEGRPLRVKRLPGGYRLCINLARMKGAGAYLIDRQAAQTFATRLVPMRLPYDHAMDREWFHGLSAACVLPFPINQKQKRFGSSIQTYSKPKLSSIRRCVTTYPYQICNELARWICRGSAFVRVKLARRYR